MVNDSIDVYAHRQIPTRTFIHTRESRRMPQVRPVTVEPTKTFWQIGDSYRKRRIWMKRVLALVAVASIVTAQAAAPKVSANDKHFMRAATMGHMAEVKMGQLAAERGQSDFVKAFGMRMVKDHGVALQELRQLGRTEKVSLPKSINAEQKKAYKHLSGLRGAEFDKAYRMHMLEDHKKDSYVFHMQSQKADNSNVRNYAMKYAPIVKMHYEMLKAGKMDM